MTRIIALLSFYDETPAWLTRCVTSLAKLPANLLVVVDGAYELYPNAQPASPPEQAQAIRDACDQIDLPSLWNCTTSVWPGEVEKRNHMFAMAESIASRDDWYFVIDADEYVDQAPRDVHARLAGSAFDVAAVTLREPGHPLGTIVYPTHPKFFRSIPGLRAIQDHFTYTTPDGRKLWGDAKRARLEPRHDLTQVIVEHHSQLRHPDRRLAAKTYYDTRDKLGIEELPAERCLVEHA